MIQQLSEQGSLPVEREEALVRFLWECDEIIDEMERALASLRGDGAKLDLIEQLYYHSYRIREGALAAGLFEVAELSRVIENVFKHARGGKVEMTSYLISLLEPGCEALRRLTCEGAGRKAEEREAQGAGAVGVDAGEGEGAPESDATPIAVGSR